MPAEIVFSGGERVEVPDEGAKGLVQRLANDPMTQVGDFPPVGWLDVKTKDGVIYVNAAEVAYVRDKR